MIIEKEFVDIVKSELAHRNWSLRELARQMDVDVAYVSRYLSSKNTPGPDVMERFLDTLGLVPHLTVTRAQEKIAASA